ncbi:MULTISPECIES: ABC transporter ATP-binding protein [Nocardiaceae]|uniref:ABC transporter ATP-binding protein n=1 Tax=Nocardiaceae TaxID=85025 RepID=UPI000566FD44|nr:MULTISPECIES: ABC transporter ATP-binding protein [Rhodococcus]OZF01647.1 nitrate ABC transporter ATP-binding protein [Rhodococcus sp. 15-1189-1-1a]OZF15841.1 nitrate ABC transporter ATP-binding protein [Rhodococcus sp. 14-2686-1-2]OZF53800.1 nitrate ABC transporter ATP-binding protein [Rhodococcus sp. 14-2470-1b]
MTQTDDRPRTTTTPNIAVADSVSRHFGDVTALHDIDLTIGRGEFVSIVGPSGCGKSTLLEIFAGLQDHDGGTVTVDDRPLTGPRSKTAIIFQESATLPWRTVRDNVAFALEVKGVGKKERRARADELLATVGLSKFGDHFPTQLSGGMRQRVAIARCLSMEPDLILADEPFGALDEQTRLVMSYELLKIVEKLTCGVLFITHSIQEAVLLSDRVLVMSARPGRFIDEMPIDLPRPRSEDVLSSPEAITVHERIWSTLRDEAKKTMSVEP